MRQIHSIADVYLFLRIVCLWFALPFLLLFPLRRLLCCFTPRSAKSLTLRQHRTQQEKICRFAAYWFRRQRVVASHTCLKQSLVLYYFLSRAGCPLRFCLGVKRQTGELLGHSWVEALDPEQADLLNDRQKQHFTLIFMYP